MPIALPLHLLAAIIWVGGMFFAYMVLRPVAATLLEPPQRLPLWSQTFARFFVWVWAAVVILPATGLWMIVMEFGGMKNTGGHVHLMLALGIVMILLFLHLFFAPYRRLNKALATADLPAAGKQLNQIRRLVGINLILGLITAITASAGRFL
ncbi:MAG: CopD family protein [Gammaproteobacteria bacterium]|nr:CopD family protein [Gammaproteobacteria bacterium]